MVGGVTNSPPDWSRQTGFWEARQIGTGTGSGEAAGDAAADDASRRRSADGTGL
jgi:hypothetical protein